jgi:L-seryl-tRNA(Ser) seleniumtransferase
MNEFRTIPSVDSILGLNEFIQLKQAYGDLLVVESVREVLADYRKVIPNNQTAFPLFEIVQQVEFLLKHKTRLTLVPVINCTGVILHTNLGRAVLPLSAQIHLNDISRAYTTVEYNLETGGRGSRSIHARELLVRLTDAEDALVCNNNAAAVLLVLTALAKRKKVAISRGQLVEIGGGFRIPEVMQVSGAKLVEVGTTNRVRLEDYEVSLNEGANLVMHVHPSNFKVIGFSEEPGMEELITLVHAHGAIFIDDIGSGALFDTSQFGLSKEPMIQESVKAGADLVCFSGDKLLGGPQAGIIVGKKELISRIKKHPLARAVRVDKLCLAALEATLIHYLIGDSLAEIPTWRMITAPLDVIQKRAESWLRHLAIGEVIEEYSTIGGGSLPGETLKTFVLSVQVKQPDKTLAALRENLPPIIARIKEDRILFDPRTVLDSEEEVFLEGLTRIFKGATNEG